MASKPMKLFGLIGYPLSHSFSKKYFTEKFQREGLAENCQYELFEMPDANAFPALFLQNPNLQGVNVTIPHKQNLFEFLSELDHSAKRVGAVNVVKKNLDNKLIGYNSDYYGFKKSFLEFTNSANIIKKKALILGYGGAAKAIVAALEDLEFDIQLVSRKASSIAVDYKASNELIPNFPLIVNCTPLGTYPNILESPPIAYEAISKNHFLFDLIYNPAETAFLKKGKEQGAQTKNGYDMLVYQAEKSWEIWNS